VARWLFVSIVVREANKVEFVVRKPKVSHTLHTLFHRRQFGNAVSLFHSLERGLKEKIPEIQEVVQSLPEGPPLVVEQVDVVLDGVRPFLQVVGGTIDVDRIEGVDSLQPTIWLFMQGSSASLNSVKLEIAQRLQRHFMMSGLQIQWKE
jgi:Fe-S cluster biogenesis protein NfuA